MRLFAFTVAAICSTTLATPVTLDEPSSSANLTLVYSEVINSGDMPGIYELFDNGSVLEEGEAEAEKSGLSKRCGSNRVQCDYQVARANVAICSRLLDVMGDPANRDRSLTPFTSQCFTATDISNNNKCCIEWPKKISGLKVHYLFNAATKTLNSCKRNNLISGKAFDVNLAGTCTNQCMSNRAQCRE